MLDPVAEARGAEMTLVHLFVFPQSGLRTRLPALRKLLTKKSVIWVSWPKKSSGVATDMTEHVIREVACPLGLVDIKVCAVDEVWSGIKLAIGKEFR